jgi:ADP-ribose pyrophosphatase
MSRDVRPEVVESGIRFHGRVFDVVVERIKRAGREPAQVEIVRHGRSVGILAMPDENTILLVRQYRHATGGWIWELPAGGVDPGETAAEAAARECQEELGLIAGRLEPLGELYALPGYCTELMTFFRATALHEPGPEDAAAHQDEDEDIEPRAFELGEVRELLRSGRLRDLKAAAALAMLGNAY